MVLERLIKLNRIDLTEEQKTTMHAIYEEKDKFSICSGCTYWDTSTLKNGLKEDSKVRKLSIYWLDDKLN